MIPFEPDAICDCCGARGATDYMGDYYCPKCAGDEMRPQFDKDLATVRRMWRIQYEALSASEQCRAHGETIT